MLIIISKMFGIRTRFGLKRYKDGWIDDDNDNYNCGYYPPNYPPPAIIEYFEFGRRLHPDPAVVLIHVKSGVY